MTRKVLTPSAAMEIKRLHALRDSRGQPVHSQMTIADMLGVSETTVFRVIHKRAAYSNLREVPTDADAAASEARFKEEHPELFGGVGKLQAEAEKLLKADRMLEEITVPKDPLTE